MLDCVYLNGRFIPADKATLGVSDLSILRGYGVFDFFRYVDGKPRFLNDHLNRFSKSAGLLNLVLPMEVDVLRTVIYELIERNGVADGGIKLVLTGGYATDGYTPVQPNLLGIAYPHTPPPTSLYERGCNVMLHRYERQLPQAKTIDYLEGIRIQPLLRRADADYPLYVDRNALVRESDRSNFLMVNGNTLITPDTDILRGITRMHLLRLADDIGIDVRKAEVSVADLAEAGELMISSSVKGVMPIGRIVGNGFAKDRTLTPGPVTKKLMNHWEAYARSPDR